jgi:peptide/nickel transport system ATP-binding protein
LALFEVKNLVMHFTTSQGPVHAVDDINFELEKGKVLGLAGESGSGKTSIAITLLKLLPDNARILGGSINLDGQNIIEMSDKQIRKDIRWKRISMIPQAAMNALNPVFRVGDQITEAIRIHTEISRQQAKEKTRELFEEVGINPDRINAYPHEFSGGMRQRAMIAMALALDPDIVIADEPTTALDVIIQAQILVLLRDLQRAKNMAMILITHDLSLVAEMSDKVGIIYGGQMVEYGTASEIYHDPKHPYTIGLLKAFPNIEGKKTRLTSIPGSPPDLIALPPACRFAARCAFATSKCTSEMPPFEEISPGHFARCWYARDMHV